MTRDELNKRLMELEGRNNIIEGALASLLFCITDKRSLDEVESLEDIIEIVGRDRIRLYS